MPRLAASDLVLHCLPMSHKRVLGLYGLSFAISLDQPHLDQMAAACANKGAQWLSGRVLNSRPKGREFEPHRRHCVVVLEQDTFILA